MSKKPIKSSLFRFVTLRSPQAIEDKETKAGFILPSNAVKGTDTLTALSAYYLAINGVDQNDAAARKTALEGADSDPSFVLIDGKTSLKSLSSDLYTFSSWLMRNKNYLTYDSVASNLPIGYLEGTLTEVALTTDKEARVWDNLLYQTINKTSVSLREALIQVLITNQFIQEFKAFHDTMSAGLAEGEVVVFTDQDEKEFVKRANASVVIEKEVLLSNNTGSVEPETSLPPSTARFLRNQLSKSTTEATLRTLKKALKDLDREEAVYKAENKQKFEADLTTHQTTVKSLIGDSNNKTLVSYTDPETQVVEQVEKYTGPELPKFNFEPIPLDFQNTTTTYSKSAGAKNFLSAETLSLLQLKKFSDYDSFDSLRKTIKEQIKEEEQIILDAKTNLEPKKVTVGGSEFTLNRSTANFQPYSFSGTIEKQQAFSSQSIFQIIMTFSVYTGRSNSSISNMTTKLVRASDGAEVLASNFEIDNNSPDSLLLRFGLPNSDPNYPLLNDWSFEANYTFENSDVVDFTAPITVMYRDENTQYLNFDGVGVISSEGVGTPTEPAIVPTLNGVTNIGIAEFLKVEQEICCYVPGEVSHIENILAKEYKEKATRSLVSSEITVEQTRESEVENLTDTTSTERNELSSEASTVIDQQNSTDFGASAFVNGSFGKTMKFGANTSFGSSSSNATSNSNNQAQSYAQEVTERALERVVQKVSDKRTSRVLREFEENNKHGFDNTKGENHITGVYRWVDKIYENQIVNYGKRLMYEFSIPEPSYFLKEALETKIENKTTIDGLLIPVEPKHPQYYVSGTNTSITASYINKDNYQMFAAKYNAEVNAYPDEIISVSKGGSLSGDPTGNHYYTNNNFDIDIPQGYEATDAILDLYAGSAGPVESDTHCVLIIGGKQVLIDFEVIQFETSNSQVTFSNPIQETLSFSIGGTDVFSVSGNITAQCKLTEEAKQSWKNETFNAIMNAYYDRVNEYNDFLRSEQDLNADDESERLKFNPAINRAMEKRELKRCAIELLTNGTNIQLAKDRYTLTPDNLPKINSNEELERDVAIIKFFEQAFDWEIMAYTLYPYYYAEPNSWSDLIKEPENGDPIFQAFMQSGMSRMVVPVREGFETAVSWYEATGEIWEGQGMVTDINDELYLSVAEEMLEPTGTPVGQPWKTRVPTSLTIVQGKSAYLDEEGLPCDSDCGEITSISGTDLVISGGTGSNASDGVGSDVVETDNNVA